MNTLKSILGIGILSGAMSLNAQNYLVDEQAVWSCYDNVTSQNFKFKFTGDTIIANRKYKKLFFNTDQNPFEFNVSSANYYGAFREDGPIVHFLPVGFTETFVLYDFTLQEGSVFNFNQLQLGNNNDLQLVTKVGMVYKTDVVEYGGVERKRLFIHDPVSINALPESERALLDPFADIWIEGIGSVSGLVKRMPVWGQAITDLPRLNCLTKAGQLIYSNNLGFNTSSSDACFILPGSFNLSEYLGIIEQEDPTSIRTLMSVRPIAIPNPVENFTQIKNLTHNVIYKVVVSDASGRVVLNDDIKAINGSIELDFSNIRRGVYHVKISDSNSSFVLKIMKI